MTPGVPPGLCGSFPGKVGVRKPSPTLSRLREKNAASGSYGDHRRRTAGDRRKFGLRVMSKVASRRTPATGSYGIRIDDLARQTRARGFRQRGRPGRHQADPSRARRPGLPKNLRGDREELCSIAGAFPLELSPVQRPFLLCAFTFTRGRSIAKSRGPGRIDAAGFRFRWGVALEAKQLAKLARLKEVLAAAAAGENNEAHRAILEAGYRFGWVVATQEEVAKLFDVTPREVRNWFKDDPEARDCRIAIGANRYQYDIRRLVLWRVRKLTERAKPTGPVPPEMLSIQDQLRMIELQKVRGEVIDRDDAARDVAKILVAARILVESLPESLALLVSGKESRAVLLDEGRRIVRDVLKTLSRIELYDEDVLRDLWKKLGRRKRT